jgi:hypothetical protein
MPNSWLPRIDRSRSSLRPAAADNAGMNPSLDSSRRSLVEPLEQRQMLSVSPVHGVANKIKVKNLFGSSGVSLNQSLVTVPLTGKVTITNAAGIQVRGYIKDPLTGAQRKIVVNQLEAPRLGSNSDAIIIHTDRLMRKNGGKILFSATALKDLNGNSLAAATLSSPKGQNKERFTLANRSFRITNDDLFASTLFAGASAPVDTSTAIPDSTVTAQLTAFLNAKVSKGLITAAQRTSALARYNSTKAQTIISNANLRAGLASLVGTVGEKAIAAILDGDNSTGKAWTVVAFSTGVSGSAEIAETTRTSTNRLRTLFKTQYVGEPFQVLGAKLAHEAMHQDLVDGVKEEQYVNTVETMVYAQQLLGDSTVATLGTEVTKFDNGKLYALLESGRALFPRVGVLAGPILRSSAGIFPNSVTPSDGMGVYTSFQNFISRGHLARGFSNVESDGNGVLNATYAAMTGDTTTTGLKFNDQLMTLVDAKQQAISDKDAIALAGILKLTV